MLLNVSLIYLPAFHAFYYLYYKTVVVWDAGMLGECNSLWLLQRSVALIGATQVVDVALARRQPYRACATQAGQKKKRKKKQQKKREKKRTRLRNKRKRGRASGTSHGEAA